VLSTPGTPTLAQPILAADALELAEASDREGAVAEAERSYLQAVELAETTGELRVQALALRRLAIIAHHRNDSARGRELCRRSLAVALDAGETLLAAEATNTEAAIDFEGGRLEAALAGYQRALELGGHEPRLRARVEQNLGALANLQGRLEDAARHYQQALAVFRTVGDRRGCGRILHNLGMLSADRSHWDQADTYFEQSYQVATEQGDLHLGALCLLNQSEVHIARQRFDRARENAEQALDTFNRLDSQVDKADAYRIIGVVFRETGKPVLAEARLRTAMQLAQSTGLVLSEAEAARELGIVYQSLGRNQDSLSLLNRSYQLFSRLDASLDLVDIEKKRAHLEGIYLSAVRDWGQSIESADAYTHGHCERVAQYAITVATALGFSGADLTAVRIAAYLHDLGKIKVPHEILNKPDRLTAEEFAVMKQHPAWGVELLESIDFPWDIKPIIRWHHEKHDGTGYPDRLKGDQIPIGAQVIGIVDVFDALTTTRSYRSAMTREAATAEMERCQHWWHPRVYRAFRSALSTF
jgi:putative nucleotidyltransferase with HDIG domain